MGQAVHNIVRELYIWVKFHTQSNDAFVYMVHFVLFVKNEAQKLLFSYIKMNKRRRNLIKAFEKIGYRFSLHLNTSRSSTTLGDGSIKKAAIPNAHGMPTSSKVSEPSNMHTYVISRITSDVVIFITIFFCNLRQVSKTDRINYKATHPRLCALCYGQLFLIMPPYSAVATQWWIFVTKHAKRWRESSRRNVSPCL